jgi:DtxR family transcriptional regulator, Mn-dependent transcriptional regulator
MLTSNTEDYLKAIYELLEDTGRVSTSALADRLGVAPASVTEMVQKLARMQPALVDYERHRGVALTEAGRKIALEVIRHHRLIELYLAEALGFGWHEVHAEAERLEHVISEEFEDRIAAALGNPVRDPHGDPIPTRDGDVAEPCRRALSAVNAGETVCVARVRDEDPGFLTRLTEIGLVLRAPITVVQAPVDGPLAVRIAGSEHVLERAITDSVYVESL